MEKARNAAEGADLIIYVVDGSCPLDENDEEILEFIKDKKAVVLLNKSDLTMAISVDALEARTPHRVIAISAKERTGIEDLENEIKSMFYHGEIDFNDEVTITNVRHKNALEQAYRSLEMVQQSILNDMPDDFIP